QLVGPMPPMAAALVAGEETSGPQPASAAAFRPRSARRGRGRGRGRARWRRRTPVLLAAIVLVAGVGGLAFNLPRGGAPPERLGGRSVGISQELAAEAAARKAAITWILHQVSPAAVVACDTQVCGDLA